MGRGEKKWGKKIWTKILSPDFQKLSNCLKHRFLKIKTMFGWSQECIWTQSAYCSISTPLWQQVKWEDLKIASELCYQCLLNIYVYFTKPPAILHNFNKVGWNLNGSNTRCIIMFKRLIKVLSSNCS